MRNPASSVSAAQHQFKSSEGLAPEHPAAQFLQLIGKDPGQTYFRTIRPGKGANSSRGGKDLHGLDLEALTRDNQAGESIYFVSGNSSTASGPAGGVRDEDITTSSTLFAEWDDRPIEWQLQAWQELGLPEPTVQVLTGGNWDHRWHWFIVKPPFTTGAFFLEAVEESVYFIKFFLRNRVVFVAVAFSAVER